MIEDEQIVRDALQCYEMRMMWTSNALNNQGIHSKQKSIAHEPMKTRTIAQGLNRLGLKQIPKRYAGDMHWLACEST